MLIFIHRSWYQVKHFLPCLSHWLEQIPWVCPVFQRSRLQNKTTPPLAGEKRNTKTVLLPLGSRGYPGGTRTGKRLSALFNDGCFPKRSRSGGIFLPLCPAGNKVEILGHIDKVRRFRDTSGGTSSSNRPFFLAMLALAR